MIMIATRHLRQRRQANARGWRAFRLAPWLACLAIAGAADLGELGVPQGAALRSVWAEQASPQPTPANADWPRWRGPGGAGVWTLPAGSELRSFAGGLPLVWKQPIGPGYSGIAVAAGRVYTMDRPAEPAGQERVVCFSESSGELLWEYRYAADYGDLDYGKGPRATPLVDDGRVYTLGAVGHLLCLDAATGARLFARDLKADFAARQPEWGFAASPIRYRDTILIQAGAADGSFLALDRTSGQLRWRGGSDPCGYATPIVIRHAGQDVMVGWTPENVLALDPLDGRVLWTIPYPVTYGVSIAGPLFREGIVLVSGYWEGSKAIRLGAQPQQASLAWEENRQLRGLMSEPLYREGHVYLLDKFFGIVCFELATGKIVWMDRNQLTPTGRNPQASLVWVGDSDRVLALNSEGELVLARFTPGGYDELQRTKLLGPTWSHPAYSGAHVFARDDEQIVAYQLTP